MSINTTANTAGTTKLNKTFYDRQLLESAKTRFVHAKYGQKRPIPKNSGKRVEFRKWNLFDANDAMEDRNSIPAVPSTPTKTVLNIQR